MRKILKIGDYVHTEYGNGTIVSVEGFRTPRFGVQFRKKDKVIWFFFKSEINKVTPK